MAAQETTPATDSDVANVYNSPRIVGGQDVTDRTQYAYQVQNSHYFQFYWAEIIDDKIKKQLAIITLNGWLI